MVCSKESATRHFIPIIKGLHVSLGDDVAIAAEDFVVLQVDGEGLDAGRRVLDLTSPLAFAGM